MQMMYVCTGPAEVDAGEADLTVPQRVELTDGQLGSILVWLEPRASSMLGKHYQLSSTSLK